VTIDFFAIELGDVLPEFSVCVGVDDVRAYLAATGESERPSARLWAETVPPVALGAFALAALMEQMAPPFGTLHAGQEFDFHRPVAPGEELTARVTVDRRAERRGSLMTALSIELRAGDEVVAEGRTMLVNPVAEGVP
jgi:hypothetical protein